jgi:hypothetical protein
VNGARRFDNPPSTELMNAAKEQMKITELRLQKLVEKVPEQATAQVERRAGQVLRHLGGLPYKLTLP